MGSFDIILASPTHVISWIAKKEIYVPPTLINCLQDKLHRIDNIEANVLQTRELASVIQHIV